MVATFKLEANEKDITEFIKENFISLEYDDKEGVESDEMSFCVHGIFSRPSFKDTLKLSLGYRVGEEDKLYECGTFSISECTIDYINHITEVRATAVNFSSPIKIKRNKTFANTTLAAIAGVIASRNNLIAKIQPEANNVKIAHIMQNNESDIEFLYILAYKNGFICAVKNSHLIVTQKSKSIDGYNVSSGSHKSSPAKNLPKFKLQVSDCSSLSITENNRVKYDACEISSHNTSNATLTKIKVGNGENIAKIDAPPNKSSQELESLATSKLSELNKGGIKGNLTCVGQQIVAGGVLELEGIGVYSIKSVKHTLSGTSYTLDIEFEA
ncbi:phage late control D family protein [Campylobacter sp. RM12637]|uniref:phage late control D family protein n=1 Tax=Campylobacter sp. RM12637 TaxID=2735734 RepID=UPI0030155724|nr:phage tail protein [Campylobacter sp. RM12637]